MVKGAGGSRVLSSSSIVAPSIMIRQQLESIIYSYEQATVIIGGKWEVKWVDIWFVIQQIMQVKGGFCSETWTMEVVRREREEENKGGESWSAVTVLLLTVGEYENWLWFAKDAAVCFSFFSVFSFCLSFAISSPSLYFSILLHLFSGGGGAAGGGWWWFAARNGSSFKRGGCAMGNCCAGRRFFFCVFFPCFISVVTLLCLCFLPLL